MKLFKKLLAVTLVAVLALTVFTACDGAGSSDDIPSDTTELRYWQTLNNQARTYFRNTEGSGMVLNDLPYKKDLSEDYTWQKLNEYILCLQDDSEVKDTDKVVQDKFDEIEKKCEQEKNYKAVLYVISEANKEPDYSLLYRYSSIYLNTDYVTIARIKDEKANKTYTMMECYQKIV